MPVPTSIYEPARVLAWLDTTLNAVATANGASGAWEGVAPLGTSGYYIVYNLQASSEVAGVAGIRLWNSSLYLIKVVGPTSSYAQIVATADAVDSALQLAGAVTIGPAADTLLMRCVREMVLPLPTQVIDAVSWSELAALWRIQAAKK